MRLEQKEGRWLIMPRVNPLILKWARETAGLSLEEAVKIIGIHDAHGKSAVERLVELEKGENEPTRPQLLKMSQKYRRSLLIFYLETPPRQGDRGKDFRTLPGAPPPTYNANLDALIRNVRTRQSLVRSILEDDESPLLEFIGSVKIEEGCDNLVSKIVISLGFRREDYRQQHSIENAFNYLREKIEKVGIFVLLMGNLGSHHSNIPVDIFRGFSISDPIAPFVIINDQDAKSAWSFTALHEIAHIWLGVTGISDSYAETKIERFCNDVASEILLPISELTSLARIKSLSFDDAVTEITSFAKARRLSHSMVAYKLFLSNIIEKNQWNLIAKHFEQKWLESKKKHDAEVNRDGGPSYYVVKRHRVGPSLLSLINRALKEDSLTYTKAGKVLGVKPRNVEPLLHDIMPFRGTL